MVGILQEARTSLNIRREQRVAAACRIKAGGWRSTFRHYVVPILLAVLGASAATTPSSAGACAAVTAGVPSATIKALAHGFNIDGWVAGPRPTVPDAAVLRELHQAGMTHIRLPVPAERLMPRFTSESDIKAQLKAVSLATATLLRLGYRVSLDLHPGRRFSRLHRDDPRASMQSLQEAWGYLAQLIARFPPRLVLADLLNEPDIAPARWQIEAGQLARFVRQRLPRTTLVVGPTYWQRADSLPDFHPLSDPNVVYAIHFYDPMVFTHQGYWDPTNTLSSIRGLPFPIRAEDPAVKDIRQQLIARGKQRALTMLDQAIAQSKTGDIIKDELQPAVVWQKRFARPLIVNEFGVLKGGAPEQSRLRWLSAVAGFAERHCWGWTHWEYDQGFGLLDAKTGKPDPAVLRALLSPEHGSDR